MVTLPIKIRRKKQMTLPAKVGADLGINEGDTVYLQKERGRYFLVTEDQLSDPTAGALSRYAADKPPVTLEDMDRAVEAGVMEDWLQFVRETEADYDK